MIATHAERERGGTAHEAARIAAQRLLEQRVRSRIARAAEPEQRVPAHGRRAAGRERAQFGDRARPAHARERPGRGIAQPAFLYARERSHAPRQRIRGHGTRSQQRAPAQTDVAVALGRAEQCGGGVLVARLAEQVDGDAALRVVGVRERLEQRLDRALADRLQLLARARGIRRILARSSTSGRVIASYSSTSMAR